MSSQGSDVKYTNEELWRMKYCVLANVSSLLRYFIEKIREKRQKDLRIAKKQLSL